MQVREPVIHPRYTGNGTARVLEWLDTPSYPPHWREPLVLGHLLGPCELLSGSFVNSTFSTFGSPPL